MLIQFLTSRYFANLFYCLLNNTVVVVFVWFIHSFVPYKPKFRERKALVRATLLLFAVLTVISYLREVPGNLPPHLFYPLTAAYFAAELVFVFIVFGGGTPQRLLLFLVEKIVEVVGMAVSEVIAKLVFPNYMYHYIVDDVRGAWYFNISIVFTILIVWGIGWAIVRLVQYMQRKNARLDIMAYVLIPASQFILFFITMVLYANESLTPAAVYNPFGVTAMLLGAFGDLALFIMIRRMNENATLRAQLEATKMQQSYYTLLEEQQKQIREMQHDINNHVAVIRSLTENTEDGTELKQYAEELTAPKLLNLHYCRNKILNALLVNKAADCSKAEIAAEFDIKLGSGTEGFDDYDLVGLVSNLLDNAIDAAAAAEDKQLKLTIQQTSGVLSILCRNTCSKDGKAGKGGFAGNRDKMTRGNGKAIINRLVKKYNGEMEQHPEDGSYTVTVMLFAKQEPKKEAE